MDANVPVFSKNDDAKFFRTLNKRVNEYFKDNNIKRTGNWKLYLKTIILFTLFIAPYFIIIASPEIHFGVFILLSIIYLIE